jgi:hypothetical protein
VDIIDLSNWLFFSLAKLIAYYVLMQPVVDAFDPRLLISGPKYHTLDFTSMKVKGPLPDELKIILS